MRIKNCYTLAVCLLLILLPDNGLLAQEASEQITDPQQEGKIREKSVGEPEHNAVPSLEETRETLVDDGNPIILRGIDIEVKGLSNKFSLRNRIGVEVGDEFINLSEFRKILDIGFNDLKRTGYFKRNIGISYRLLEEDSQAGTQDTQAGGGEEDTAGKEPRLLRLEAKFQDSWTIYPIPYPYYSTSSGFGVKARLKWDNFLGLLSNVTFRADFLEVRQGNYGWDFSGGVGLSTIKITPDFGINGSLEVARDARTDGANWKIGAGLGASFSIPLLETYGIGMGYSVSNGSSIAFGYTGVRTTHSHFSTSFNHGVSLGKETSSWGGVFRSGYSFSFSNSFAFDSNPDSLTGSRALALEDINFNFSMKLSRTYFNFINFKGRFGAGFAIDFFNGKYNPDGYNYGADGYNRGIRSETAAGNFIAYLNIDVALLVFSDSVLGDVLLEPFIDLTWVKGKGDFRLEDTHWGTGLELIWIFHSLKFRFSYGVDLRNPGLYTISITTGFYF